MLQYLNRKRFSLIDLVLIWMIVTILREAILHLKLGWH